MRRGRLLGDLHIVITGLELCLRANSEPLEGRSLVLESPHTWIFFVVAITEYLRLGDYKAKKFI